MSYDTSLANRVREFLLGFSGIQVEEKEMFRGLTFMINGKMCISISGENLMCRFDPDLQDEVAERQGYEPMIMRGKQLKGYCYVDPTGFKASKDFEYWVKLCLNFNSRAKSSKKKK